jgi:hypothetical protein
MDWRPLMGLTPDDAGTFWERVLALTVVGEAVQQHNADVDKSKARKK